MIRRTLSVIKRDKSSTMDTLFWVTECEERRPSPSQFFTGQAKGETGSEVDWIIPPIKNDKCLSIIDFIRRVYIAS